MGCQKRYLPKQKIKNTQQGIYTKDEKEIQMSMESKARVERLWGLKRNHCGPINDIKKLQGNLMSKDV